eukprot:33116-Prymnesium_polylepis.1
MSVAFCRACRLSSIAPCGSGGGNATAAVVPPRGVQRSIPFAKQGTRQIWQAAKSGPHCIG